MKPRIGGRLMMNNHTLNVYSNDNLQSVVFSLDLDKVKVKDYKELEECWQLIDASDVSHKQVVCSRA